MKFEIDRDDVDPISVVKELETSMLQHCGLLDENRKSVFPENYEALYEFYRFQMIAIAKHILIDFE